ncbi:MAG TPA: DUF1573 domain-containing protein [Verrucomicrobiae bacterium]|nr:DUF1573 domain-containing protein [Verrucomicrobiae bacterium]
MKTLPKSPRWKLLFATGGFACALGLVAQQLTRLPEPPPLPPFPDSSTATPSTPSPQIAPVPLPQNHIPPQFRPIPQPNHLPATANTATRALLPANVLAWDADIKEYNAKPGETNALFTFNITNISSAPVMISQVKTSCGCTTAHTQPMPWVLQPKEGGEFGATVDLRGKVGTLNKALTVETDKGFKVFMLKIVMPDVTAQNAMGDRARNTAIAAADRQAVFRGECASCHATPTVGLKGEALYQKGCAICHDSEHRASMVPDLKNLPHPTDRNFWAQMVSHGKVASLMPAFAAAEGGPLNDEQIQSLADFLVVKFPSRAVTNATATGPGKLPLK